MKFKIPFRLYNTHEIDRYLKRSKTEQIISLNLNRANFENKRINFEPEGGKSRTQYWNVKNKHKYSQGEFLCKFFPTNRTAYIEMQQNFGEKPQNFQWKVRDFGFKGSSPSFLRYGRR